MVVNLLFLKEKKCRLTTEEKKKRHAEYMRKWRKEHPDYIEKQKASFKNFIEKNPEYFYEYNQQWRKEHSKQAYLQTKRYRQRHPEKKAEQRKRYANRHSDRNQARRAALKLKAEKCSICGSIENLHRHHPDYSQPLKVVILCRDCHNKVHAQKGLELLVAVKNEVVRLQQLRGAKEEA